MEPIRNPKLADAIADHIEQLILEGALRPGEKLASERDLAEKLEVSRPSLREALDKLEARKLVTSSKSGNYVAQFMAPMMAPLTALLQSNAQVVADYFEYRTLVEGGSARLAAERATEFDREAIRACLQRLQDAHALADPTAEVEADADLHMLIYEAAHNLVVLHVMRAFSEMLRGDVFYNRQQLYLQPKVRDQLLAQHLSIGTAVIEGNPAAAEAAASQHIGYTAETIAALQRDAHRVQRALRRLGRGEILSS